METKIKDSASVETGQNLKTALLRLPAFFIDAIVIMATIIGLAKLAMYTGLMQTMFSIEWLMFLFIPLSFFVYWSLDINIGKRLFGLIIVDAKTGSRPTLFQYFRRCLLFSLVISLNVLFLIPLLVSKKNQGFQDMLAGTLVVRKPRV